MILTGTLTAFCSTDAEYVLKLAEIQANSHFSNIVSDMVARTITFHVEIPEQQNES